MFNHLMYDKPFFITTIVDLSFPRSKAEVLILVRLLWSPADRTHNNATNLSHLRAQLIIIIMIININNINNNINIIIVDLSFPRSKAEVLILVRLLWSPADRTHNNATNLSHLRAQLIYYYYYYY